MIRFALCTDLHHDLIPDAPKRLEEFLDGAQANKVDFIIHLGDFCCANPCNRGFLEEWKRFEGPAYHVLGNHDLDHNTKQQAVDFLGMPAPFYAFDCGSIHFVVLDVNHLSRKNGVEDYGFGNYFAHPDKLNWLGQEQLAWVAEDLARTQKRTVFFSHQSLADSTFGARDAEALHAIFRREEERCGFQKVIACFNGHDHTDGVRCKEGVYYISVNGASFFYMSSDVQKPWVPSVDTERFPILREAVLYQDVLYTIVTITEESISLSGKKSRYVGPSPIECGHCGHQGGHPASAEIREKRLWLHP